MVVVCRQGWENKLVSDAGGAWGRGWIRHLLILQQAVKYICALGGVHLLNPAYPLTTGWVQNYRSWLYFYHCIIRVLI